MARPRTGIENGGYDRCDWENRPKANPVVIRCIWHTEGDERGQEKDADFTPDSSPNDRDGPFARRTAVGLRLVAAVFGGLFSLAKEIHPASQPTFFRTSGRGIQVFVDGLRQTDDRLSNIGPGSMLQ